MPRLNVNIDDETAATLQRLAAKRSITLTETFRRALSCLYFLESVRETHDLLTVKRDSYGIVVKQTQLIIV